MSNGLGSRRSAAEALADADVKALLRLRASRRLLPPGYCLTCGHHEDTHLIGEDGTTACDTEVSDHGVLDCECPNLRLCAACEGDPEALDLHVCGRGEGE